MFLFSELSIKRASRRLQWVLLSSADGVFLIKAFRTGLWSSSFSQSKVLRVCEHNNQKLRDTHKPQLMFKGKLFVAYESLDPKAAKCINDLARISFSALFHLKIVLFQPVCPSHTSIYLLGIKVIPFLISYFESWVQKAKQPIKSLSGVTEWGPIKG